MAIDKQKIVEKIQDEVIIKWADSIRLPSGYDPDLDLLYKMILEFLNSIDKETITDIGFIQWYSGMEESKIQSAYKRYLSECK